MAWESSTDILIEGFREKLAKTREDAENLQKKRQIHAQSRIEEIRDRLIFLKRSMDKSKKNRQRSLNTAQEVLASTLKEYCIKGVELVTKGCLIK